VHAPTNFASKISRRATRVRRPLLWGGRIMRGVAWFVSLLSALALGACFAPNTWPDASWRMHECGVKYKFCWVLSHPGQVLLSQPKSCHERYLAGCQSVQTTRQCENLACAATIAPFHPVPVAHHFCRSFLTGHVLSLQSRAVGHCTRRVVPRASHIAAVTCAYQAAPTRQMPSGKHGVDGREETMGEARRATEMT